MSELCKLPYTDEWVQSGVFMGSADHILLQGGERYYARAQLNYVPGTFYIEEVASTLEHTDGSTEQVKSSLLWGKVRMWH